MGSALNVRTLARLIAGLCVTALLFGDVARGVHLLLEPHVVCLAHGELIEASEAPSDGTSGLMNGAPRASRSGPAADHHEHCAVAATPSRPLASTAFESLFVTVAAPASEVDAFGDCPTGYTRAALTYAPKQGPPA